MKTIISMPNSNIDNYISKVEGIIIGVENLSIGFSFYYKQEELESIIKYVKSKNKEIFISLNKNMYNSDLKYLKETIILLNTLKVTGIIYYDISIYNIVNENKLDVDLYWQQEHLTTNYFTCNFWHKRNVKGTILSNDITIDEIIEIRKNTNMKLIVKSYGYIKMMASSRKLISNYLAHLNKEKISSKYKIYERISNENYPIIEDENGTITLTKTPVNGIKYLDILEKNNIDYLFLDGLNIENFTEIIDAYNNKDIAYFKEIDEYFFNKETIYKVKK